MAALRISTTRRQRPPFQGRWWAWLAMAAALWMFFSPSLLPSFARGVMAGGRNDLAIWDAWIAGATLISLSTAELVAHRGWHAWSIGAFGLWFALSPAILDFHAPAPRWNAVATGVILALVAASLLLQDRPGAYALFRRLGLQNALSHLMRISTSAADWALHPLDEKRSPAMTQSQTPDPLVALRSLVGDVDDVTLTSILALSPSSADIEEALYWLNGYGELAADGEWPLKGKAAAIYDLLAYEFEDPRPNGQAA